MPLRLVRHLKRSPHWYIRGSVRGQAIFETTGTDDAKAADALRIKRESELLDRSVFGPGATVTFLEAAVSYLDNGGEPTYVQALVDHFTSTQLCRIGQAEVDGAAKALFPGTKASTRIRGCYGPIKAILNHAAKKKWCPLPAVDNPDVDEVMTKFSSPERLEKLLPHCAPKLRRFVMVDTYTGGRLSEILRIDWDRDVFLARRTIILWRTKTKQRPVYIPDPLLIELSRVPEADRHGPMFNYRHKSHVHRPLKNACKRAGVEYLPPHQQGRHTYATWMVDYAGLDLKALMDAGGWESVQSVIRYLHVTPGKAAKRADLFPGVQNPCTTNSKPPKDRKTRRKIA